MEGNTAQAYANQKHLIQFTSQGMTLDPFSHLDFEDNFQCNPADK